MKRPGLIVLLFALVAATPALAQGGSKASRHKTLNKTIVMRHSGANTVPAPKAKTARAKKSGRKFARVHFRHR